VWLYTVMVHPRHQGRGYGRDLLSAAEDAARGFDGIEAIRLTCRGGNGLERFYGSCGYKEVGRVPGAIRVAPGDDRDDVHMLLTLS
jgi:GNAT superfamily N-acetyltransferase